MWGERVGMGAARGVGEKTFFKFSESIFNLLSLSQSCRSLFADILVQKRVRRTARILCSFSLHRGPCVCADSIGISLNESMFRSFNRT